MIGHNWKNRGKRRLYTIRPTASTALICTRRGVEMEEGFSVSWLPLASASEDKKVL